MKSKVLESRFSFWNGWSQVKRGDTRAVRSRLMTELGITSRLSFLDRLNGKVIPKVTDYEAIERVFAEFGILDVWGEVPYITKIERAV